MSYMRKYHETLLELNHLKEANRKRDSDSLAKSAISFIHKKGLSCEWADWIVKEIDERTTK